MQSTENNSSGNFRFPLGGGVQTQPFVLTRRLGRDRASALKSYARARSATLNDALLTLLYRCLFRRLAVRPGTQLQIPVMVDMRRCLRERESLASLANLTSTVSTHLEHGQAERFDETLGKVKAMMDHRKRCNAGLNGFIKLDRVYRFMGSRIANRLLMARMRHPWISMTNMGILDPARLWFGDQRPSDAFLCGSVKCNPYFQLAVSSYDGELTLSVNVSGSDGDRDRILSFFDDIEAELATELKTCITI